MENIDKIINAVFDKCKIIEKTKNGVNIALYDDNLIEIKNINNKYLLIKDNAEFCFKDYKIIIEIINNMEI